MESARTIPSHTLASAFYTVAISSLIARRDLLRNRRLTMTRYFRRCCYIREMVFNIEFIIGCTV